MREAVVSLSTKILTGLGLGVLSGIFFGEEAAFLKMFGEAFILLLQMTVLPYIMVFLVTGLGGLSFQEAAVWGVSVACCFWCCGP